MSLSIPRKRYLRGDPDGGSQGLSRACGTSVGALPRKSKSARPARACNVGFVVFSAPRMQALSLPVVDQMKGVAVRAARWGIRCPSPDEPRSKCAVWRIDPRDRKLRTREDSPAGRSAEVPVLGSAPLQRIGRAFGGAGELGARRFSVPFLGLTPFTRGKENRLILRSNFN